MIHVSGVFMLLKRKRKQWSRHLIRGHQELNNTFAGNRLKRPNIQQVHHKGGKAIRSTGCSQIGSILIHWRD